MLDGANDSRYRQIMQILFVDESGTAPPPEKAAKSPVFVLGGFIVSEDIWPKLKADLDTLKRRFKIDGEIKWRYFAPWAAHRKPNPLSHLSAVEKEALREGLLDSITKYKSIRIIAVVVDVVAAYGKAHINSDDDLYNDAFKQLSERFQYYLQDLERSSGSSFRGMIVCDNRNNDQDDRLKEFHQRLLAGHGSYTSSYANLVEGLFIAASHHSIGTQFADLVAGAIFRSEARGDARFVDRISPAFRRSPSGKIDGYGIVRIPKR